jgi:CobQ-like glutamine amidotransferase family enzyme
VLAYDYFHCSQLGGYSCQGCHFKRPHPQVEAVQTGQAGGLNSINLIYKNEEVSLAICGGYQLPKNASLTDYLIRLALQRHGNDRDLKPLDDIFEERARSVFLKRLGLRAH